MLRPDTTKLAPTIWLSSYSHQFEFGCVLPGPRLSNGSGFEVVEALFAPCAPSRHHETYWWAGPRFSQSARNCFASRASAISIQECDKTTRRANQSKACPSLRAKIFRSRRRANSARLTRYEGRLAIVTNARWDAVDADCAKDERA